MGRFQKKSQGSPHILQSLIINLVCCFFDVALAQPINAVSKAFDSLNFPMEAITCLVNLLVFGVILIRGRLDLDNGAREVLGTLRASKLEKINGINCKGLTTISTGDLQTASVVMLSNGAPNCSMKQFMKSNAVNEVHSILLQYLPLNHVPLTVMNCEGREHGCNCIVFSTVEEITSMLDRRMPGTLKRVSDSMCLLPCLTCLKNGCHGCNYGLLHVDQLREILTEGDSRVESTDQPRERLTEGGPRVESPAAICQILDEIDVQSINAGEPICICIPMNDARNDKWTELLVSSFRSKDAEDRGVRLMASEALQDYLDGQRGRPNRGEVLEYNIGSFIWPRFSEILINILLTFWFKVDGFSSSLVARRTVRNYLVDSKGNGLAANAFLTKATVHTNNTNVCQALIFRGNRLSFITLSFVAGGVNMICFIGWAVLIAFEYGDSSLKLSEARVVAVVVAIGIACFMDCLYMYSNWLFFRKKTDYKVLSVIILEIACIVAGSLVATILVPKMVCRDILQLNWVNSVNSGLQVLVWVKWVIGSCILDEYTRESSGYKYDDWKVLVFSSAFLLNAVLAGVRTKWTPSWPWEKNYLFNYIFQNGSHHAAHNASHAQITGC